MTMPTVLSQRLTVLNISLSQTNILVPFRFFKQQGLRKKKKKTKKN